MAAAHDHWRETHLGDATAPPTMRRPSLFPAEMQHAAVATHSRPSHPTPNPDPDSLHEAADAHRAQYNALRPDTPGRSPPRRHEARGGGGGGLGGGAGEARSPRNPKTSAHSSRTLCDSWRSRIQPMAQVEKRWPEGSSFLLLLRHVARVVTVGSCLHETVSASRCLGIAQSETHGFRATRRSLAALP